VVALPQKLTFFLTPFREPLVQATGRNVALMETALISSPMDLTLVNVHVVYFAVLLAILVCADYVKTTRALVALTLVSYSASILQLFNVHVACLTAILAVSMSVCFLERTCAFVVLAWISYAASVQHLFNVHVLYLSFLLNLSLAVHLCNFENSVKDQLLGSKLLAFRLVCQNKQTAVGRWERKLLQLHSHTDQLFDNALVLKSTRRMCDNLDRSLNEDLAAAKTELLDTQTQMSKLVREINARTGVIIMF
jgi:hypothetical protein